MCLPELRYLRLCELFYLVLPPGEGSPNILGESIANETGYIGYLKLGLGTLGRHSGWVLVLGHRDAGIGRHGQARAGTREGGSTRCWHDMFVVAFGEGLTVLQFLWHVYGLRIYKRSLFDGQYLLVVFSCSHQAQRPYSIP